MGLLWWKRSSWHGVARVGDVAAGALVPIRVGDHDLVLGRAGESYFAVQRQCPHKGSDLISTGMLVRDRILCRQHGWRFSTETGAHDGIHEACLAVHRVRVVGDVIEVEATPKKTRA